MAKKSKTRKGNRGIETAHQRILRELREAGVSAMPGVSRLEANGIKPFIKTPREPRELTFNWQGAIDDAMFVPRLAEESEIPNARERAFVNITARGEADHSLDRAILEEKGPARFVELVKEGIHRWHSYGKER